MNGLRKVRSKIETQLCVKCDYVTGIILKADKCPAALFPYPVVAIVGLLDLSEETGWNFK